MNEWAEYEREELACRVRGDWQRAMDLADSERGGLRERLKVTQWLAKSNAQERDILLARLKDLYERVRHEGNYALADELRGIAKAAGYNMRTGKDGLTFYGD